MTDRHIGYIIVLEEHIREDDAEATILNAIRMIKGVATVDPIFTDSTMIHAAEVAAESDDR